MVMCPVVIVSLNYDLLPVMYGWVCFCSCPPYPLLWLYYFLDGSPSLVDIHTV